MLRICGLGEDGESFPAANEKTAEPKLRRFFHADGGNP